MTEPRFRSDMGVTYIDGYGTDASFYRAAKVSTASADPDSELPANIRGLLNYLISNRHTSPFEHGGMTFLVEVPIFVSRELVRHRTLSFNETSGRYRKLDGIFYKPVPRQRPMTQEGKAAHYTLGYAAHDTQTSMSWDIERMAAGCWHRYEDLIEEGAANEVARMVLPVSTFTQLYISGNPLNWLRFLTLRTAPDALYEIRDVAEKIEKVYARKYPITHELWNENGRQL